MLTGPVEVIWSHSPLRAQYGRSQVRRLWTLFSQVLSILKADISTDPPGNLFTISHNPHCEVFCFPLTGNYNFTVFSYTSNAQIWGDCVSIFSTSTHLIVYSSCYYLLSFLQYEQKQGICIMLYFEKENGLRENRVKHNLSAGRFNCSRRCDYNPSQQLHPSTCFCHSCRTIGEV